MRRQIAMKNSLLKTWAALLCLLLTFSLESCAQSPDPSSGVEGVPVPRAGYDVEKRSLKSESAYQVDFKINAIYPDTTTIDFYTNLFAKEDWHICANDGEWVEYDKRVDNKTNMPTRQKLQYVASKNEKKLLLVTLRYFGNQKTDSKESREWNNKVQHVTVVLYDLSSGYFDKTLSLLSLRCSF